MRRLGWAFLGAIAGGAGAIALCVAAAYAFDITQAEGAYAMQVAFFWTPLGVILGAIAGAILPRGR
jgi:hypothetical protein